MPVFFEEKSWVEKLRAVFWGVLVVGIVVVVAAVLVKGRNGLEVFPAESYQAVFLDNGQVYFGKIGSVNKDFLSLTEVYYLRAGSLALGEEGSDNATSLDLVKLGAELHAPRDQMVINKEHILFYEELGQDGEIMKLIRKHKDQ